MGFIAELAILLHLSGNFVKKKKVTVDPHSLKSRMKPCEGQKPSIVLDLGGRGGSGLGFLFILSKIK